MEKTDKGNKESLVIGRGEIGTSLANVLSCDIRDREEVNGSYDVLHICFPYFEGFEEAVIRYKQHHNADLVIVHSTVPVGTCDKIGAVHSHIKGVHPNLGDGIKTFTKFFGGKRAKEASEIFSALGIKAEIVPDARTSEAMKIWSTNQYFVNVVLMHEIAHWCKENDLDFDYVYTRANQDYNEGYEKLGRPEYKKYLLKHIPGKIGGHCLVPNAKLIKTWIMDLMLERNETYDECNER